MLESPLARSVSIVRIRRVRLDAGGLEEDEDKADSVMVRGTARPLRLDSRRWLWSFDWS